MTLPSAAAARGTADLAALHEALDVATFAALAASGDNREAAHEALIAASLAAADAFPEGSPDYQAFCQVLDAVRGAMEAAK